MRHKQNKINMFVAEKGHLNKIKINVFVAEKGHLNKIKINVCNCC